MTIDRTMPDPATVPTITARRLASISGLSVRTIYAAVADGRIPSTRVGRRIVIPTREALAAVGLLPRDAQSTGPDVAVPSEVLDRIRRLRGAGLTSSSIAVAFAVDGVPGPGGEPWTAGVVEAISGPPLARAV